MNRRIPLNDLVRQNRLIHEELVRSANRVMDRGWYVLGSEGADFEKAFAAYCGVPHAVGVANGTDGIELALRAVGVEEGHSVATVANAGFYASTSIHAIGARPLYVDVVPDTYLMSIASLKRELARNAVRAVIVTHLYGRLADIEAITAICAPLGIPVIEDCAQAHGATRNGRAAGSFGAAGCFSFYPTKNLGALGDGGAVMTSDAGIAESVRMLRQYGWSKKYQVSRAGGRNSRLDELQAALLLAKLPHLDRWNEDRRTIARRYSNGIKHARVKCPQDFGADNAVHLFVIRCEDRDGLRRHLEAHGIDSDIHYPIPDHRQPAYTGCSFAELPETERLAGEIVTLPCFSEMEEEEISGVIDAVNAW
ncbi:DegT/DnrJ/EryC1/StrS family aminotransferase [Bradyrhizobium sp.]|jgi:dTDP-4-amino-4,6-dideoxygalactose transaminase|uniref:DegT/DnrJ/EryC1/StrS family aminotransferase n=1 Tax=Bradyrhizobium sp. TaxID=376 RepID=UPI002E05669E|nr:DegT/DnrJ/EryC1/StrS family aminotransferase [Bradyrhizobium sp.]